MAQNCNQRQTIAMTQIPHDVVQLKNDDIHWQKEIACSLTCQSVMVNQQAGSGQFWMCIVGADYLEDKKCRKITEFSIFRLLVVIEQ